MTTKSLFALSHLICQSQRELKAGEEIMVMVLRIGISPFTNFEVFDLRTTLSLVWCFTFSITEYQLDHH